MSGATHQALYEFMQFRVTRPLSSRGKAFSMPATVPFTRLDEAQSVITRDFVLTEELDDQGRSLECASTARATMTRLRSL